MHAQDMPRGSGATFQLLPHCTERAIAGLSVKDWAAVFARAGLYFEVLRAGRCGMAGTYGHEAENRETSERNYNLSWREHIAATAAGTVLATGYSCRCQAKRLDGAALPHPATALLEALRAVAGPTALHSAKIQT